MMDEGPGVPTPIWGGSRGWGWHLGPISVCMGRLFQEIWKCAYWVDVHFKEPCFKCLECQQHWWEDCQTGPVDFDPTDYGHGCKDLLLLIHHVGIPRTWMTSIM